jgi:hypothetical protein
VGGVTTDQRGAPRPADDPAIANALGGDGSDIGAGCVQFAVVDAKTGATYAPPFYVGPRAQIEAETEQPDEPLRFRLDSKLLIVSGAPNEKNEGLYYYKWDKRRFVLLARTLFKKR